MAPKAPLLAMTGDEIAPLRGISRRAQLRRGPFAFSSGPLLAPERTPGSSRKKPRDFALRSTMTYKRNKAGAGPAAPLQLPPNAIPRGGVAFGAIFEILTFRGREKRKWIWGRRRTLTPALPPLRYGTLRSLPPATRDKFQGEGVCVEEDVGVPGMF